MGARTGSDSGRPPAPRGGGGLYWRWQGGAWRAWANLRKLGGGCVGLRAPGAKVATDDPAQAAVLLEEAKAALRARERQRVVLGIDPDADLVAMSNLHLDEKQQSGRYSAAWLRNLEFYLERAAGFFLVERHRTPRSPVAPAPQPCNLHTVTVRDVRAYAAWLRSRPGRAGATLGPQSIRHHLGALSGVFERAISEGKLPMGHNPVAAMMDRPGVPRTKTLPMEPWEVALLLESARTFDPKAEGLAGRRAPLPCAFELLAFLAYTGAREGEARGADVGDVHLAAGYVEIRGTKTAGADRIVPLAPELVEVLRAYLAREARLHGPLFTNGEGGRVGDWRKVLDRVAARAGFLRGAVRSRRLRVSYATHRCTCDGVDANTVRLELGHGSLAMMERVYARAQRRAERMGAELSYRLERWRGDVPADRLSAVDAPLPNRRALEVAEVVRRFLAAVAGLSGGQVEALTGVPDAVVNKLRAGAQTTVKGRNLARMREHLARSERGAA